MTLFKAQALMRNLKQELLEVLAGVAFTDSTDSNGMPILKLVASSETIFVKIEVDDPNDGRVNSVGVAQTRYSPHKSTLLQSSTATSKLVRYVTEAKVIQQGTKVLMYEIASLPSNYDLSGATLIATIWPDSINKLTNQQ